MSRTLIRVPLTFPLPKSDTVEVGNGSWYTQSWKGKEKLIAERNRYALVTLEEYETRKRRGIA